MSIPVTYRVFCVACGYHGKGGKGCRICGRKKRKPSKPNREVIKEASDEEREKFLDKIADKMDGFNMETTGHQPLDKLIEPRRARNNPIDDEEIPDFILNPRF